MYKVEYFGEGGEIKGFADRGKTKARKEYKKKTFEDNTVLEVSIGGMITTTQFDTILIF